MLQSMGLQRLGHNLATEQQKEKQKNHKEGGGRRAEGPSRYTAQLSRGLPKGPVFPQQRERSGCVELQVDMPPAAKCRVLCIETASGPNGPW